MGLRNRQLFKDEQVFFVTVTTHLRKSILIDSELFDILSHSLEFVGKKFYAKYLGYVFLPNHIHLVVYFEKENNLSALMRDFKKFTSGEIRRWLERQLKFDIDQLRFERKDQKFKVWSDRFDDMVIKDVAMVEAVIDYIHNNPLQERWQSVSSPELYCYSSAEFYFSNKQSCLTVEHYRNYF